MDPVPFGGEPHGLLFLLFFVLSVNFITFTVTSISKDSSSGGDILLKQRSKPGAKLSLRGKARGV